MTESPTENQVMLVPEGVQKVRADKFLAESFDAHSRSDFHRAFEAGLVSCNGSQIAKNRRVSCGDEISFSMPKLRECEMGPVDMNLEIVFEDEDMVIVNKRPGVVVHPGAGVDEPTLAHGLLHHCQRQLSGIGGVERPGIVHRLDRDTSGLIIAAKNDIAHRGLSELFQSRNIVKEYLALVQGIPELRSGSIKKHLDRHKIHRHKMTVCQDGEGRFAHTDWKLEKSYLGKYSLIRCRIHTGRTHQIRVHLKHLGHALLGDVAYGYRKRSDLPSLPERVMLHSSYLKFVHPKSNEELELVAPLPDDFLPFSEAE